MTHDRDEAMTDAPIERRSPALAIGGLIALGVAAWGLTGGPDLPDLNLLPWILLALGLVAGLALIASGIRRG